MTESVFIKLITAGDGGVGKTTLLFRYIDGIFSSDTKMTLGVDFMVKELIIENFDISLQIWDFSGQEQFRHMLQAYALGARGALLLFDLTRVNTLLNIEEWVQICRKFNKKLPILLLGAKSDLKEQITVDDKSVLEIKEKYDFIDYLKVSSKNGRNVIESFDLITNHVLKREKY